MATWFSSRTPHPKHLRAAAGESRGSVWRKLRWSRPGDSREPVAQKSRARHLVLNHVGEGVGGESPGGSHEINLHIPLGISGDSHCAKINPFQTVGVEK